jgi:hypothetical protein
MTLPPTPSALALSKPALSKTEKAAALSAWKEEAQKVLSAGDEVALRVMLADKTSPARYQIHGLMRDAARLTPPLALPGIWQAILDKTVTRRDAMLALREGQALLLSHIACWDLSPSEALGMREKWSELLDSQDMSPLEMTELFQDLKQGNPPDTDALPLPVRLAVASLAHAELQILRKDSDWDRFYRIDHEGYHDFMDMHALDNSGSGRVSIGAAIARHPILKDALALESLESLVYAEALPEAQVSRRRKTL